MHFVHTDVPDDVVAAGPGDDMLAAGNVMGEW